MSRLYWLACTTCEERVLVGKNTAVYGNIGDESEQIEFLFNHSSGYGGTHALEFLDEHQPLMDVIAEKPRKEMEKNA